MQQTIDSIIQKHYKRFEPKQGDKVVCTDKNLHCVDCRGVITGMQNGLHVVRWEDGKQGLLYKHEFRIIKEKRDGLVFKRLAFGA